MFQTRQIEDIMQLVEVSKTAALSPGAVGNGTTVSATAVCAGATFALGDQLEIFAPASAATNGVLVSAAPTATAGTAQVYWQNQTGGSITPVASQVYTIVATRITPTLI